jgi:hypothetical protein
MDVHTTEARQIQGGAREDQTVSHDDQDIRLPRRKLRPIGWRLQGDGLGDRDTVLQGRELHGAGSHLAPATFGPVRLCEHADELVARPGQRVKRGQRELRRSSERNAQAAHVGNNLAAAAQYV